MKSIQESISIIIPAYQEAENIGKIIQQVQSVCAQLHYSSEIIVVCDGSTDGTADIAEAAGATVVRHAYNKGYGAALKTGVTVASGQTVIFIDSDCQHDPNDIPRMMQERKNYDMVVGARKGTAGSPLWRKPGKLFLGWMANSLTGRKIPDLNSGYRALDKKMALKFLPLMPNGFSFSTTSTIAAFKGGYTIKYIPIKIFNRSGNKSTVSIVDGLKTIMLIVRIVTLFSPLRIFLPISLLALVVGLTFTVDSYFTAGVSSIRGLIALLTSIQLFLFGILIDQVVAIRRGENIQ